MQHHQEVLYERRDRYRGEVLTDRGLSGGVGRDELAEVVRVVRRPPAEWAPHLRAATARLVPWWFVEPESPRRL